MISQLVKIIPGNTSSLFPISRKGDIQWNHQAPRSKQIKRRAADQTQLNFHIYCIWYCTSQKIIQVLMMDEFMKQLLNMIVCLQFLTEEVPQDAPFRKLGNPWGKGSLFSHLVSCIVSLSMVTGLWAERVCWAKQPFT